MGAIGATFRHAGQAGLAHLTLPAGSERLALHQACGFVESVYLATCNRVALFFVGSAGTSVATYRERVFQFFAERAKLKPSEPPPFPDARALVASAGEGAVEQLFVVAAALDSMVPGEAQILGQVKAALREALALGTAGRRLQELFADAFAVAKEVRSKTDLGKGHTSMFSLVASLLGEQIARHDEWPVSKAGAATVAIVGVGEMSVQCGEWLATQPEVRPLFVNRTRARAEVLASRCAGQAISLADFQRAPGPLLALVTSTSSDATLFQAGFLQQLPPSVLLIDLAVSRDIDLGAAQALGLALWDIDRLQSRASAEVEARRAHLGQARAFVDDALERFRARVLGRSMGDALVAWRAHGEHMLASELEQLAGDDLSSLSARQRFGRRLLNRWLHGPTIGLRALGREFGVEAVEAFVAEATHVKPRGAASEQVATPRTHHRGLR